MPISEHGLLAAALRDLRSERRPDRALLALDDYLARFPQGALYPEAMRLHTEALLRLGRKHAALDELDRQSFDGTAGGEEHRLLRGQLRAAAGRWRAAFEDFDAVVRARLAREGASLSGEARSNEPIERALWGRASARSHFGDDAGARTDLREYLRLFPQGRFATQATHLLGELR
jgi:TolA-binding protein